MEDKIDSFEWHDFERNEMFLSEMREFIENSMNYKPTSINLTEGSKSIVVAEAVKKSFKNGSVIKL